MSEGSARVASPELNEVSLEPMVCNVPSLVSQQHADGFAFGIAGDNVNLTVSIYIAHGHSPCSPAGF